MTKHSDIFAANETQKGLIELATVAEAVAGTDTSRAVTPQGLAAGSRPQVNLLSNTGWQVWSYSGLTQGTTGRQTDFNVAEILADADGSTFASWSEIGATMTDAGANLLITEAASGGTQTSRYVLTVVVGKLYKVAVVTANGTGAWGATDVLKAQANGGGAVIASKTNLTAGTHSIIFKATATNNEIELYTNLGAAGGTTLNITSIYVDEVTPGCIAANTLGPDGWYKHTSIDIWREHNGTNTKDGSYYSLKGTSNGAGQYLIWNVASQFELSFIASFEGRTITIGSWIKTSTANHIRLRKYDNGMTTYSDYHTGGGGWEWLELTGTFSSGFTTVAPFAIFFEASGTAYISQPMLVFGSAIGEGNYVPPQDKIINCEANIALTDYTAKAVAADTTINIEAQTSGKIGKGVRAYQGWLEGQNSAADKYVDILSASGGVRAARLYCQVATKDNAIPFRAIPNASGDLYIDVEDANWTNVTIQINAVEIR